MLFKLAFLIYAATAIRSSSGRLLRPSTSARRLPPQTATAGTNLPTEEVVSSQRAMMRRDPPGLGGRPDPPGLGGRETPLEQRIPGDPDGFEIYSAHVVNRKQIPEATRINPRNGVPISQTVPEAVLVNPNAASGTQLVNGVLVENGNAGRQLLTQSRRVARRPNPPNAPASSRPLRTVFRYRMSG